MGFKDIFKKQNTEKKVDKPVEKKVEYFTDKLPDEVFAKSNNLQKNYRKIIREGEEMYQTERDYSFEMTKTGKSIIKIVNILRGKKISEQEITCHVMSFLVYEQIFYVGKIFQAFDSLKLPLPDFSKIVYDNKDPFTTNARIADAFYPIFLQHKDELIGKVNNFDTAVCAVDLVYSFDLALKQFDLMREQYPLCINNNTVNDDLLNDFIKFDSRYYHFVKHFTEESFLQSDNQEKRDTIFVTLFMTMNYLSGKSDEEIHKVIKESGVTF